MRVLELGYGVRFVCTDDLVQVFEPLGFTKNSFYAFLKVIKVKKIRMPNGLWYIDFGKFTLAMSYLGMWDLEDSQDFLTPAIKNRHASEARARYQTELNDQHMFKNLKRCVGELLLCMNLSRKYSKQEQMEEVNSVARRFMDALSQFHDDYLDEVENAASAEKEIEHATELARSK